MRIACVCGIAGVGVDEWREGGGGWLCWCVVGAERDGWPCDCRHPIFFVTCAVAHASFEPTPFRKTHTHKQTNARPSRRSTARGTSESSPPMAASPLFPHPVYPDLIALYRCRRCVSSSFQSSTPPSHQPQFQFFFVLLARSIVCCFGRSRVLCGLSFPSLFLSSRMIAGGAEAPMRGKTYAR